MEFIRRVVVLIPLIALAACRPSGIQATEPSPSPPATHTLQAIPTISTEPAQKAAEDCGLPPSPTPTTPVAHPADPPCTDGEGEVVDFSIDAPTLGQPLAGRIYLPPCYREGEEAYPVLYLLHGLEASDEQWDRIGLDEAMDAMLDEGGMRPFLVVMPREPSRGLPPENKYGEAIVKDLLPWVDKTYATVARRDARAIGGVSRGGNWALRLGFKYWQTFAAVGAHSAPLFYGDLREIPEWLDEIPDPHRPRLFLDMGEDDPYGEYTRRLVALLEEEGIPHQWHLYPGGHEEAYWRDHLPEYLDWYSSTTWVKEKIRDSIK
ncbi:MAG: alpha/beta hydrolase-fold protein [Anaerolineales bacterium]